MAPRLILAALCTALLAVSPVLGREATPGVPPRFEDHPAGPRFTGPGRLVLTSRDRSYRIRLREAARQPADFAGHYVMALWGCGAECVMGAAIDLRSGRVIWLPATLCCWYSGPWAEAREIEPVRYRLDSGLIVLRGLRDERDGDLGEHFYRIGNGRFVHLADQPPASAAPAP